ncbi:MAG: nucleotidyltransferase [Microgenomates group bacterium]
MAISNDQLQTWANAPGHTKAQHTYQQIKNALTASGVSQVRGCEVYLQGSYANSTNIRHDSDIDVVIQLNSSFAYGLNRLTDFQKSIFHLEYPTNATFNWSDLRSDVIAALVAYFSPSRIDTSGNKSIKLIGDISLSNADIVPCLQYRNYNSFNIGVTNDFIEGMRFWTIRENTEVINYPKVHKANGENKNAQHRTDEMYKDTVRVIKHIRRKLIDEHNFDGKKAPSYFIESAVYNAFDQHFSGNHQSALESVLDFLIRRCDASRLVTVSHQHLLFGTEIWQWNKSHASEFLEAVEYYYLTN